MDARAAALVGGSRGPSAGVTARVLPGGYGRVGGVMTGEWLTVGVVSTSWSLLGSDTDLLPG
jgi:hypothetical protein